MSLLVTGGAGFIGSHVVDLLLSAGETVTVIDNLDEQVHGRGASEPANLRQHEGCSQLRFIRGDVRDISLLEDVLPGHDRIVHLAAAVGVGQSMYSPVYYADVNVRGQAALMEVMARNPEQYRRLVVAASMSAYGEGAYACSEHGLVSVAIRDEARLRSGVWEPACPQCGRAVEPRLTSETQPLRPTSIYAITKQTQEQMALCFGAAYGIPTTALRFFNVYGSRQALSNPYTGIAAIFSSRVLNGEPPLLFEDGEQTRDFVHVHDVARAVVCALDDETNATTALNVCTGRATTVGTVARSIARVLESEIEPHIVGRYRVGDIRHCVGDPEMAQRALGFSAKLSLEDGLLELLEWLRSQQAEDRVLNDVAEMERRKLLRPVR